MGVFWGKIGEGVVRYWPLTNSFFLLGVFTSVPILVKIDQEMRPWECSQTEIHWQIHWQTQSRKHIICPMLYAIAMGQITSAWWWWWWWWRFQDVPPAVAKYRFRTLTKLSAVKRLQPQGERSKTMSRPERITIWHVHSVLDTSLVRRTDVNLLVDEDVATLVHYRQTTDGIANAFNSTAMKRFKSTIIKRLLHGISICLQ